MQPSEIRPFQEPLAALHRLLQRYDNQGVVIGGIAASILGRPRFTNDLDAVFLLSVEAVEDFLGAAQQEDILPRIDNAVEFGRQNRVLLLRHAPSDTAIDISLGILPFEVEMVARSSDLQIGDSVTIRLPTPEDLIIMKAIAHRPKDLEDISQIVKKHQNLDVQRIKDWVAVFAEALGTPALWTDIAKYFA